MTSAPTRIHIDIPQLIEGISGIRVPRSAGTCTRVSIGLHYLPLPQLTSIVSTADNLDPS